MTAKTHPCVNRSRKVEAPDAQSSQSSATAGAIPISYRMDSAEATDMARRGFMVKEEVVPPACGQRYKITRSGRIS